MINYYKELNIRSDASVSEIKKAYLEKLKNYHPDVYKGNKKYAEDKTALLNECYSVLKDENLRRDYDLKLRGYGTVVNPVLNDSNNIENFARRYNINLNQKQTKKKEKKTHTKVLKKKSTKTPKQTKTKVLTKEEIGKQKLNTAIWVVVGVIVLFFVMILIL